MDLLSIWLQVLSLIITMVNTNSHYLTDAVGGVLPFSLQFAPEELRSGGTTLYTENPFGKNCSTDPSNEYVQYAKYISACVQTLSVEKHHRVVHCIMLLLTTYQIARWSLILTTKMLVRTCYVRVTHFIGNVCCLKNPTVKPHSYSPKQTQFETIRFMLSSVLRHMLYQNVYFICFLVKIYIFR